MKDKTIKWIQVHIDEINNNALAMKITEEDKKLNDKDLEELYKCIKWLKGK